MERFGCVREELPWKSEVPEKGAFPGFAGQYAGDRIELLRSQVPSECPQFGPGRRLCV